MDPVISVITPVKDTEPQSLLDCANSILNGSLQQIEWILVDDGSHSFRTIDVLKAFQESSDPRIRLLQVQGFFLVCLLLSDFVDLFYLSSSASLMN